MHTAGAFFRSAWRRIRRRAVDAVTWLVIAVVFLVSAFLADRLGLHGRGSVKGVAAVLAIGSAVGAEVVGEGWHRLRYGPRPPARHKRGPEPTAPGPDEHQV